jgi:hypothetical protein
MSQTVQYNYGYGGFTLNELQQQQLKILMSTAVSSNLSASGVGVPIYNYVLDLLENSNNDSNGIDHNVVAWIAGAAGVNNDSSSAGQFIRNYTSAVYQIRYGQASTQAQLNYASNQIAIGFAAGILANGGNLPSIEGLGAIDAGYSASNLFTQGTEDSSGVYSPWAGTLLFPFLNDSSFYKTWLLNMNTVVGTTTNYINGQTVDVKYKSIPATYDIVATLKAYDNILTFSNVYTNLSAALSAYLSGATGDPTTLVSATQSFFLNVYGLMAGQVSGIGTGTPFGSTVSLITSPDYIAGTVFGSNSSAPLVVDDTSLTAADVVNAGPADDFINVVDSDGLIDGGGGKNVASYASWFDQSPLTISLQVPNSSYFSYRFDINAAPTIISGFLSSTDYLYDVQSIVGDSGGDVLDIGALTPAEWTAIGQSLSVNLGSSAANQVNLEGVTSGTNVFSVAPGSGGNDVVVSAVTGSVAAASGIAGIDVSNPGTIQITPGPNGDTVLLSGPASYKVAFADLPVTTTIDLEGFGTTTSAALGSNNALTVKGSANTASLQLASSQSYAGDSFVFSSDGNGGSNVSVVADSGSVTLPTGNALLLITDPANFTATVSGLQPDDVIDLAGIGATNVSLSGNTISYTSYGSATIINLSSGANYAGDGIVVQSDGNGGTDLDIIKELVPVTDAPTSITVTAGRPVAITPFSVALVGGISPQEPLQVVLSDTTGFLTAALAAGGTVAGNGSTSLRVCPESDL